MSSIFANGPATSAGTGSARVDTVTNANANAKANAMPSPADDDGFSDASATIESPMPSMGTQPQWLAHHTRDDRPLTDAPPQPAAQSPSAPLVQQSPSAPPAPSNISAPPVVLGTVSTSEHRLSVSRGSEASLLVGPLRALADRLHAEGRPVDAAIVQEAIKQLSGT